MTKSGQLLGGSAFTPQLALFCRTSLSLTSKSGRKILDKGDPKGRQMPGDPKECRRHAARCAELAVTASTPQLKGTFLELSENWEKLAIQLENTFAKIDDEIEWVRESLDAARPFWTS